MPPLTCNGALVRKNAACLWSVSFIPLYPSGFNTYYTDSDSCTSHSTSQDPTSPRLAFPNVPTSVRLITTRDVAVDTHENPFMEAPPIRELRRPRLKSNCVANKSREVLIVEPPHRVLIGLDTDGNAVVAGSGFAFRFVCVVMPSNISAPDHQDISLLQCRSLPLQRLLDLYNRNLMSRHRQRRFPILLFIPST